MTRTQTLLFVLITLVMGAVIVAAVHYRPLPATAPSAPPRDTVSPTGQPERRLPLPPATTPPRHPADHLETEDAIIALGPDGAGDSAALLSLAAPHVLRPHCHPRGA